MSDLRSTICAAGDDAWTLAEGSIDGRPSVVRFRRSLSKVIGHPELPKRLLITWDYGDDGEDGMPEAETSSELEAFESALQAALDPDRTAVLACVFTHVGSREWHYYFDDIELVDEKINEALADQPDLPISIKAFDDPEWSELAAVLESIRSESN
jgi:hypothetical protein